MIFDVTKINVGTELQPAKRARLWQQRFEHLSGMDSLQQLQQVTIAEIEYQQIKAAYERMIEKNIILARQFKNSEMQAVREPAVGKIADVFGSLMSPFPANRHASMSAQQENQQIVNFIRFEERKLLELQTHLYEHSPFASVRNAMRERLDYSIAMMNMAAGSQDEDPALQLTHA